LPDGTWSSARPVAGPINTPGSDGNPVLHPDGSTLYFVSDGHPGLGGLDLFRSERQPDGSWGVPVNLGYPINTHHDESSVLVTPDGRWALFATDRDEPGNLDLWELKLPDELVAKEVRVLRGRVYDVKSGLAVEATVDVVQPDGRAIARVQSAATGGGFELPMPEGDALRFRVDHPHYAFYSELVSWEEVDADREVEIGLTRFEVGTVLTLKDVRFASGSADLEAVFQPELEQLAALLLANEERVQIIGHTDNRGSSSTNQALSEARAEAVRAYLAEKGVPTERMLTEGRGDGAPIATNETEAGRALNRRTEIVVIE
jgi:outer membrane protein OmpA-like peptidoglycan-associated protein